MFKSPEAFFFSLFLFFFLTVDCHMDKDVPMCSFCFCRAEEVEGKAALEI